MSVDPNSIVEALPYFKQFAGKTIVIKYGGSAQIDPVLRQNVCKDLVLMQTVGIQVVLVHGGGVEVSKMMERLGKVAEFIQGLRVTDEETAEIAEMVLVGKVNKTIVAEINLAGGTAVGLSGRDGKLVLAEKGVPIHVNGESVDLGQVGTPTKVDTQIIQDLLSHDYLPVVAPTGMGPDGEMLNINGDTVAAHVAGALSAEKLIFLTDQKGIMRDLSDETSLINQVEYSEIDDLRKEGVIGTGMIPKAEAAQFALDNGVNNVHILDGTVSHSLLLELFTSSGVGTMLSKKS
ncbi:MAG: acetylglutamate kinase [Candidatus Lindowbacteria bacterium]|nr:acetylglutamate kinase [Candidatus Lindowbacteria bacterium]